MATNGKIAGAIALLVLLSVIPARAHVIKAYNFSTNLVGVNGTVTGSFTFDSTTKTFLTTSLLFTSSLFGNVTFNETTPQKGFLVVDGGKSLGTTVLYSILVSSFNINEYWVSGVIGNSHGIASFWAKSKGHGFKGKGHEPKTSVPEGSTLELFLLAGVVTFAGIYFAPKQRQWANKR